MSRLRAPNTFVRYLIAVASVVVTALATRLLWTTGDRAVFPLFFAAVVFSAFYGGVGPSLVATVLSAAVAELWLVPEARLHAAGGAPGVRLAVFLVVALVASSLNVALRRAREGERRAKRLAEEANTARSRFVAMVTHELRTPLNLIILLADQLRDDPSLCPEVRQQVGTIASHGRLQARLVEDLLDVSRLSSGKLRLNRQPLDLRETVRSAVRICEPDAGQRGIVLSVELPEDPIPVNGDAVRLEQILWNLIRNAVKFTARGGRVKIGAKVEGQAATAWIADTGIGIAPDRLSEIFRAFEQENPDVAARFGGLGLGLAICRALAEAHGGVVTAQSEGRGRGATFTLALPVCETTATELALPLPAA